MADHLFGKSHLRLVVTRDDPNDPKPNGPITVIVTCPHCAGEDRLRISSEGAVKWHLKGELIQHAFPELTRPERERLITGICPSCWVEIEKFAEEEGAVT